jgi:hypothetical protein
LWVPQVLELASQRLVALLLSALRLWLVRA